MYNLFNIWLISRTLRKHRSVVNEIPHHARLQESLPNRNLNKFSKQFNLGWKLEVQTTGADIIAIDGKTGHSFEARERTKPLHSVSAWNCSNQLVLTKQWLMIRVIK